MSSIQPAIGTELTADLSDPDTGVTGVEWKWYRLDDRLESEEGVLAADVIEALSATDEIDGETTDSYTPVGDDESTEVDESDEGMFLVVVVTYNDAQEEDDAESEETVEGQRTIGMIAENAVRAAPDENSAPEFAATMTRMVDENTMEGGYVGDPVTAMDMRTRTTRSAYSSERRRGHGCVLHR